MSPEKNLVQHFKRKIWFQLALEVSFTPIFGKIFKKITSRKLFEKFLPVNCEGFYFLVEISVDSCKIMDRCVHIFTPKFLKMRVKKFLKTQADFHPRQKVFDIY